jgi:hypothetical protein
VSPLRGEALREAISAPARAVGVSVEPELIERLLADAASEPGILPLLQETMVQLWDARTDETLTLADVRERRGRREQRPDRAGCMMVVLWAPASTGSTSADPVGLI